MVVTSSTAGRISAATGLNRVLKDAAAHVYFPEVAHAPPVQIVVQCSPYSHPSLDFKRSPSQQWQNRAPAAPAYKNPHA